MNIRIGLLASAAVGLLALAASTPASAQAFGSASFATYRDCSTLGAGGSCDGTVEPQQRIITSAITGGTSSTSNTNLTLTGGSVVLGGVTYIIPNDPTSRADGTVTFGGANLPVLKGESVSGDTERMGLNEFGYQTYTAGASSTPFSITGTLDIDAFSGTDGGIFAGGAIVTSYVEVLDPSILTGISDVNTLFNNLFESSCGSAGVLASSTGGGGSLVGTGASATFTTTTSSCSGSPLMLDPGQTVLVVAGLQLLTNRGGSIDALDTFTTNFTRGAGVDVADLTAGSTALGVPEPAAWAMMLTGFFGLGSVLRRRRAALAV
jgi:hypothetical protein